MIEVRNIKLPPAYTQQILYQAVARKLKLSPDKIKRIHILRHATDARKKEDVHHVIHAAVEVNGNGQDILRRNRSSDILVYEPKPGLAIPKVAPPPLRPVICGAGPAGLFAALILAQAGAMPLVIERGQDADRRVRAIEAFREKCILDTESNIQFGEGGAGTFSDGKLTTGTHDPRGRYVLETFAQAGAPEEILWLAKPHIGTDLLPGVIKNIRRRIEALGGEVRFETRLADLAFRGGALCHITTVSQGREVVIPTDRLILATGHSARDVFELLYQKGAAMLQKPFSIGVRIEHPQGLINFAQYGKSDFPGLGAADYKLSCHLENGRSVYTFCMCPGGEVVAAASEAGGVVTNGMSRYARDGANANSAYLVNVTPEDFGSTHPLAGVQFQRRYEAAAYAAGGRTFRAPAQLLGDFLQGAPSTAPGCVAPSYPLGVSWGDVAACLPDFAADSLRRATGIFAGRLRGFDLPDAVLTGVETRSSSPVRILRDESLQSNLRGIYPCGEGAGYAGGILSAAVDGIRVAQAIAEAYQG